MGWLWNQKLKLGLFDMCYMINRMNTELRTGYEKRDHNFISREKDASSRYKTFFLMSSNELLILTNRNPLLTGM